MFEEGRKAGKIRSDDEWGDFLNIGRGGFRLGRGCKPLRAVFAL